MKRMETTMTIRRFRSAAVATGAMLAAAASAALEPGQFMAGWPLELPVDQKFFDVPLTVDVYRAAPSADQLAVLDAAGVPMPFYIVSPPPPAASERRATLAASPLYAAQAGDAVAELRVGTDERRTNVTITQPAGTPSSSVVAFVVDARSVERAPYALELDWRALPQPFLADVTIEQSRTLSDWRFVGRASVAALSIGGGEIRHGRVPVAAAAGGYFRITASRSVADWYLTTVTVISSEVERPVPLSVTLAPLDSVPVPKAERDARASALYFDAGGTLPVSDAHVDFGSEGGWLRADVATSDSLEGPWSPIAVSVLFYDVAFEGERVASQPLELGRRDARYWRLAYDGTPPPRRVELALDYAQERLRFSAEGTPPYMLVAGTRAEAAGPDRTFTALWTQLRPAGATLPQAVLGARRELGGAAALVAPFEFPWRSASLWVVLGAGVLAVGWMAARLAREMHGKSS